LPNQAFQVVRLFSSPVRFGGASVSDEGSLSRLVFDQCLQPWQSIQSGEFYCVNSNSCIFYCNLGKFRC